jgi:hypothetical protein
VGALAEKRDNSSVRPIIASDAGISSGYLRPAGIAAVNSKGTRVLCEHRSPFVCELAAAGERWEGADQLRSLAIAQPLLPRARFVYDSARPLVEGRVSSRVVLPICLS